MPRSVSDSSRGPPAVPARVGRVPELSLSEGIFREYDVRGLVGSELSEAVYERMGGAFGEYLRNRSGGKPSCAVGRDNRPSSQGYCGAFVAGLRSIGCDAIDIGLATTPELYFANVFLKTAGAAVITASHNPPEYNGVKFVYAGKSAGGKEVQEIKRLALANKFSNGAGKVAAAAGKYSSIDIFDDYLAALSEGASLKRLKVAVDCGNGIASEFAVPYLRKLGCKVVPLHCDASKPFSVHLPDPVQPENYVDLVAAVRAEKADVGLMFDGDGDRVGAVDETGKIVWPDQLLMLFARRFLKSNPAGKVLIEIKCSKAVEDDVLAHGGRPVWSATGRTVIEDLMFREGAKLAGEMSGHFFFSEKRLWLSEAMVAARKVLEIISDGGALSKQAGSLPRYVSSQEYRVTVPEERKFAIVKEIAEEFKRTNDVVTLDGAKVLFSDGWGLVRASNNEPKLSMRFESKTAGGLKKIMAAFSRKLKEKGVAVPF